MNVSHMIMRIVRVNINDLAFGFCYEVFEPEKRLFSRVVDWNNLAINMIILFYYFIGIFLFK